MRIRPHHVIAGLFSACCCLRASAADIAPGPGIGSVLQMFLGLAVVLGIFGAIAWLMKRSGAIGGSHQHVLKLVATVAVGTRERVVLIEVGEQWILVGVAPGSVSQLACLPRGDAGAAEAAANANAPAGAFAGFLKQVMDKRNAK